MNIKSSLVYPLLKSFVPLFVGGSYHLLKQTLSLMGYSLNFKTNEDGNQKLHDHIGSSKPDGMAPFDFLALLNQVTFGIYTNFFAFLFVMLLIDIICKIAQKGTKELWREVKTLIMSLNNRSNDSKKKLKPFRVISENQMMNRIFCYAMIFVSFQILGVCLSSCFTQNEIEIIRSSQSEGKISDMKMMMNLQSQEDYFSGLPRILSEEDQSQVVSTMMTPDKISLSMRNILSSLNINVNAMVLSKDRKIAYATVNLYGTLKIIDISDMKSPFILGSLNLKASQYGYRIKSLALSSDEKTLYASNSRELEIIDVSDYSAPKLISFTKSEIFNDDIVLEVSEYFLTSLAVSESTKTLYIGGLGLQVYDISNQKKPILLKAVKNPEDYYEGFLKNEICLSRDGNILFMANGTLDVYDISNPQETKWLNSLKMESNPRSLFLSEDGKTIFLLGNDVNKQLFFEEVDRDSLSVRNTFQLGNEIFYNPRFLTVSPSKSKFFISVKSDKSSDDFNLLVFDYLKQTTTEVGNGLMENTFTINFSPDGRTLIAGANSQFLFIELYLDYPNSRIFSENLENKLSNFSLSGECQDLKISNDGKYLFILRDDPSKSYESRKVLEIWDVSNSSAPHFLNSYRGIRDSYTMYFAKNFETVYLLGVNHLTLLDISDKSSIKEKKTYKTQAPIIRFYKLAISSDGETGFLFMNKDDQGVVSLMNFSETTGLEGFVTLDRKFTLSQNHLIVKDDKTLIVLDEEILIYDISNLHSPVQVTSLPYGINETKPEIISYTLSPDAQTLFIHTSDRNYFTKLRIYNVSNVSSPHLISDQYFSKFISFPRMPEFIFPSHSESGWLYQSGSFIKLNLTDLKKPMISNIIPLRYDKDMRNAMYTISPDGQTIYKSTNNGKEIQILNANIEYTLYLNKEKYLLGEKYSNKISMLRLNGKSDYDLLESQSYKIIKLSLLDIQIAPNKVSLEKTISPLPSWMIFDGESNTLTLNPKRQSEIGEYTLHSAFSLKVPVDIFNGSINATKEKPVISEDLVAWLMSLDYLDSELFLTAKFKSLETFYLPAQFLDYKKQIYNILKGFYIETCTMFDVISSLEFNGKELMVSSLSTNNIKAEITVHGSGVKFVNVPYGGLLPLIRENKTKAVLEGSMAEVNLALKSVVVNFENGASSDANIVIKDGLNPPVLIEIFNISRYFKANTPPRLNDKTDHQTLQEQIENADIQTGKYFTYSLTNDIFEDDYAESLTYEVVMAKNGTGFPTWLTFSGLTLKGTPPEEIFGRDIDLILIAKNEFKQCGVPFKVHIKISAVFWLKLLSRYSPYILTLLGLLVSANKIFNILAKRRYRHPVDYQLNVGEEILPEVIPPILFIGEESKQTEAILKYLKKSWRDFIDPTTEVLDKQKIIERIQEGMQEMSFKEREKINRYPSKIIDQLVINKFVQIQLDSDLKTKSIFEELKSKCLEIVEWDSTSRFKINQNKLKRFLIPFNKNTNNDLEESLISSINIPGVNLNLLQDTILAYAFDVHSVDISPVDVDIIVKQHVPSRLRFSFLKLDLRDINLNDKNKLDYGINYKIKDDKLCFYGVTQSYFQNKTLAVQIKNIRHKILKEIWIHGVSNNLQESLLVQGEQESRGQGYEIF